VLLGAHSRFLAVGLDPHQACHAVHFAVSFVMGHSAHELGAMVLLREGRGPDPASIEDPIVRDFFLGTQDITSDEMFDSGLDMVVAGLRARYGLP
jgi:hypothetical protein